MFVALTAVFLQSSVPVPPPLHQGSAELTCPVGGERFTATTTPVYSVMGRRPDGKPYSEVPFPRPVPECPGNGLIMFASFTPAEVEQLSKWIATPVYQEMRQTESPYYRAFWLAKKIGKPDADAIEQLLPAIWAAKQEDGADPRRLKAARYQRAFVAAVESASPDVPLDDRVWLQEQAANALREMGDFAGAERMLGRVEKVAGQITRPALKTYMERLKAVIARRDRSDEPLDMIPDVQAAIICKNKGALSVFERSYCARPDIAKILGSAT